MKIQHSFLHDTTIINQSWFWKCSSTHIIFIFKVKWPWYVGSTEWLVDLLGWFFKITHLVFTLKPQNEREKETKKNLQFFLGFRKLLLDFNIVQKTVFKEKMYSYLTIFSVLFQKMLYCMVFCKRYLHLWCTFM